MGERGSNIDEKGDYQNLGMLSDNPGIVVDSINFKI
jgi:hypothetical protein